MEYAAALNIMEIHLGPTSTTMLRELTQHDLVCPGSPMEEYVDGTCCVHHLTQSQCLSLFKCLLQNQVDLLEGHLTFLQRLSGITEMLSHLAQHRAAAGLSDEVSTEARVVFELLLSLPCSQDFFLMYAKQKALAMFLIVFRSMMNSFFTSPTAELEEKISVGCCLQDAAQNLSKSNPEANDQNSSNSLTKFIVVKVLPNVVANSAAVSPLVHFFTQAIEYGQHAPLMASLRKNGCGNFERLIVDVLISNWNEPTDWASQKKYKEALCLSDRFLDYVADMGSLSSSANHELYGGLVLWTVDNADFLVERSRAGATFTFADKVQRLKEGDGKECCCQPSATLTSVLLKALCIQARSLGRKDPEVTAKFLTKMNLVFESLPANCDVHRVSDFGGFLFCLFGGDDEDMCGAMLYCLHLHLLLEEVLSHHPKRSLLPEPSSMFDLLIEKVCADHWILVSWISDDQNCFLVYFMQYLKYVDSRRLVVPQKQVVLFRKLEVSLRDSQKSGTLAFNSAPLLRRLLNVIEQNLSK
ncbi:hypothetical protein RvY_07907 [Ramazzottius varieornatus]|uniref:Protein Lines N-terminal domain-containing protein n=1 Tax=Ramazzottius varieornatus TaxID=947166 RepID=A0A1D1VD89_RAMVA|nr:hypothetical protein RvY_07907 [Ramazzottius varieornatus]